MENNIGDVYEIVAKKTGFDKLLVKKVSLLYSYHGGLECISTSCGISIEDVKSIVDKVSSIFGIDSCSKELDSSSELIDLE